MLLASEASDKSEAKTQEQVFGLPISKMPHDYFKYEVAFFKEVHTDCAGFIMNLAQMMSHLSLATAKRKRDRFIMSLSKFYPALAP